MVNCKVRGRAGVLSHFVWRRCSICLRNSGHTSIMPPANSWASGSVTYNPEIFVMAASSCSVIVLAGETTVGASLTAFTTTKK